MHVRIARNHQCVKLRQPVTFANAHKAIRDSQKQPDASQLVNVQMVIQIARIQLDVRMAVVLTNVTVFADQT